jgi:hypothetical protein
MIPGGDQIMVTQYGNEIHDPGGIASAHTLTG